MDCTEKQTCYETFQKGLETKTETLTNGLETKTKTLTLTSQNTNAEFLWPPIAVVRGAGRVLKVGGTNNWRIAPEKVFGGAPLFSRTPYLGGHVPLT